MHCEEIDNKDITKKEIVSNDHEQLSCEKDILEKFCSMDQKNMCRICLTFKNIDMSSLLSTENISSLGNMFTRVTSIPVRIDDNIPTQICGLCRIQVVDFYEFKLKCEKAHHFLESMYHVALVTKEEPGLDNICTINKMETDEIDIKEEYLNEEYLEEISEAESDVAICIVQRKEQKKKNPKLEATHTDFSSLTKDVTKSNNYSKGKRLNYMCSLCPKRFIKLKSLNKHTKEYHGPPSFAHSCKHCKNTFKSEHDLNLHLTLHMNANSWKCNECNKEFKAKQLLRRHILRHMDAKRYSCTVCEKRFAEHCALQRHLRVHTGESLIKKHACEICDKKFSERAALNAHKKRHSGARPCVCATCGKSFPSIRLLASHNLVHSTTKPYACNFCDKRFRHESTRNTHHRTHTGEKPYVCSICGKTFIQSSNLTLHMRVHTGEKPYKCNTCQKTFTSGSTLKNHERTHTGEKPYSCPICGKRFARVDMTAHMRQHTGERPYACTMCPKKFVTSTRLRDHCRIHTGEKPYECVKCSLKLSTKSHLLKHTKTHQSKRNTSNMIIHKGECKKSLNVPNKHKKEKNSERIEMKESEGDKTLVECENVLLNVEEVPIEFSEELVLQHENDIKTDIIVVDNSENTDNSNICHTNSVNVINNDVYSTSSDVNLVTVNNGEVSISASSATVKLYQLDQSLVQIHSSGRQVTISKITSKMTTNID